MEALLPDGYKHKEELEYFVGLKHEIKLSNST